MHEGGWLEVAASGGTVSGVRVPRTPLLVSLAAGLALLSAAGSRAVLPTLYFHYAADCTFQLVDDSGNQVTTIPPGSYQVVIDTPFSFATNPASCPFVKFDRTGPGSASRRRSAAGSGSTTAASSARRRTSSLRASGHRRRRQADRTKAPLLDDRDARDREQKGCATADVEDRGGPTREVVAKTHGGGEVEDERERDRGDADPSAAPVALAERKPEQARGDRAEPGADHRCRE